MKQLLYSELIKLKSNTNIIIGCVGICLYFLSIVLTTNKFDFKHLEYLNSIRIDDLSISVIEFIYSIFIIVFFTKDYTQKTIFRTLFEGQSRVNIFHSSILFIVILSFIITLFSRISISLYFIFNGANLQFIYNSFFQINQILLILISLYLQGLVALLLIVSTKKGQWALIILFSWILLSGLLNIVLLKNGIEIPNSSINKLFLYIGFIKSYFWQIVILFVAQIVFLYIIKTSYLRLSWLKKR